MLRPGPRRSAAAGAVRRGGELGSMAPALRKAVADLKAILYAERARRYAEFLPALSPHITVIPCQTEAEAREHAAGARALATWAHEAPEWLLAGPEVEWVHSLGVGVEQLLTPELVAGPLVVTNSRGTNAPPIAEYVMATALAFGRQLPRWVRQQTERRWARGAHPYFEVAGKTLGILGLGSIGREVAARAGALGMRVLALRRGTDGQSLPGVAHTFGPGQLHDLLGASDIVVITLPLTPETRGLLDAPALAAMRPGAYLINVARGAIVDEPALIAALQSGHLGGAGLDVFDQEPLPPESPLWDMPKVIITPHVSSGSPLTMRRSMALWADNLERFAAGQPLRNQVNKQVGY